VTRTDSTSVHKLWSTLQPQIANQPGLTVGEEAGFAKHGGCINLLKHEQRIRFEINLKVAEAAGLQVSAKLASMARRVETEAAP
jgi:hypothetical protein